MLTSAVRELLGKNESRSEKEPTKVPVEIPQLLAAGTTSGVETQLGSNMELTLLGDRVLNLDTENANQDRERGVEVVEVERMGQECNPEFPIIERHL